MARELHEQVEDALYDVLLGGWAKYLELEDGTQVRAEWKIGAEQRYLEITHTETGHQARLAVVVTAALVESITPDPEHVPTPDQDPDPVERTWAEVCEGDQAQGGDGQFYPVVRAAEGSGPNAGLTVVTMVIGGQERTYPMPPDGAVQVKRGETGMAADTLRSAGLGPEVLKSGALRSW